MWGCGGRRRRRVLFGLLLLATGLAAMLRFNWSTLVPRLLWGRVMGLQAENSQFLLEGMPFRILGGSIHYFRVPRLHWKDRLLKMRACGLNTLTTYVPWNLHEATRGKFDFTGNLDLKAFITIASQVGLWVILRPGPYICSEWDLGGLPSWLLQDPEMQLRTTYKGFTEAVDAYFDQLMKQVVPLQYKRGGPIIAVQVENEYGSYFQDSNYMPYIKMALLNRGIVELLMTSDNKDGLPVGIVEGALATINFQKLEKGIGIHLDVVQHKKPMLVMEYWTGWFDSWGGPHFVYDADDMVNTIEQILKLGASINLYMFHGGTNFGFMNGAVHFDHYKPVVTSYDYDALLTEAGDYTSKYFKLRQLLSKMLEQPLPLPPLIYNKASYGVIQMQQYFSLWEVMSLLLQPIKSELPVNMENLQVNNGNGQAYGYVLYETLIPGDGQLNSGGHVRDRAQVFINTWFIGYLDYTQEDLWIPPGQGYRLLRLLVENCGRVNYGPRLNDQRKGLIGDIFINKTALRNFKIYSLPMDLNFMQRIRWSSYWNAMPDSSVGPAFFRGTLRVEKKPQDTFLKTVGWEKGAVFVNGQNLGRYWNVGPQSTLYLPETLLHQGDNEIIIFEEHTAGRIIESTDLPFLGKTKYVD
ncbi:beta-galactosidase-1-like protein 2 [Tiliqua scincoides]|uniref:beta-galactosidase-1-like protein 2 n=1 Tax=Tiliqua scincoides TaxID=71010 RepID=UPI0034621363